MCLDCVRPIRPIFIYFPLRSSGPFTTSPPHGPNTRNSPITLCPRAPPFCPRTGAWSLSPTRGPNWAGTPARTCKLLTLPCRVVMPAARPSRLLLSLTHWARVSGRFFPTDLARVAPNSAMAARRHKTRESVASSRPLHKTSKVASSSSTACIHVHLGGARRGRIRARISWRPWEGRALPPILAASAAAPSVWEPCVPPELVLAVDALIGKTEGGTVSNFSSSTALCHDYVVSQGQTSPGADYR
jgi:hypothetical protein